jgi:hypothetical protein
MGTNAIIYIAELENERCFVHNFFNSKMSDHTDTILLEILTEMKTANQNARRQVDLLETLMEFVQTLVGMVRGVGGFMGAF